MQLVAAATVRTCALGHQPRAGELRRTCVQNDRHSAAMPDRSKSTWSVSARLPSTSRLPIELGMCAVAVVRCRSRHASPNLHSPWMCGAHLSLVSSVPGDEESHEERQGWLPQQQFANSRGSKHAHRLRIRLNRRHDAADGETRTSRWGARRAEADRSGVSATERSAGNATRAVWPARQASGRLSTTREDESPRLAASDFSPHALHVSEPAGDRLKERAEPN